MESRTHRGASPLPGERPKKDRSWRFYAAIVVAVVATMKSTSTSWEFWTMNTSATTSTPLFFVLIITFALGALAGWLWPHVRRDRRRQRDGERH